MFEDEDTDGRLENEEAALLEDHESNLCDPDNCHWCIEEAFDRQEEAA
jgi:hypothetical protein